VTKTKTPIKRIEFLAKRFQVCNADDIEIVYDRQDKDIEVLCEVDKDSQSVFYAMHTWNQRKLKNENEYVVASVMVYEDVFINIVQADPTEHKEYVQWMLETFVRLVRLDTDKAIRCVKEDLWLASEYLELFHNERHKPKFKALCRRNKAFKDIKDPSNINQYRDLSQLFDAIDPYIIRNPSKLEKDIRILSKLGGGNIPYEDRKIIVFTPKTIEASRLFAKYSNWCTTSNKETFQSYVSDRTPRKTKEKLYILMPKTFLLKEEDPNRTDEIYQLHFERRMLMDRSDRPIKDMNMFIKDNVGLGDYFYEELIENARANHSNYQQNPYVDGLKKFGFTDLMFEVIPVDIKKIQFLDETLTTLEPISKFKNVYSLFLRNCDITEIHPNIGGLELLGNLSLPNNKIKSLPKSIGKLKNLTVMNVSGNLIEEIPETIKELDKSNGGSLEYFSYGKNELSDKLVSQLKEWLPNTILNEFNGTLGR
jgi:hypothetical protein